ncbi:MAG: hypothetical protein ACYDD4_04160 [Acidimicrobiales bacterium]
MSTTSSRILRAAVLVAAAVVVYLLVIPVHTPRPNTLGRLVIGHPTLSSLHAQVAHSQAVPTADSNFAGTRKAGKDSPDSTGVYERAWYVSTSGPPEAGIVVQLLPDAATAQSVERAAAANVRTAPKLQEESAGLPTSFRVPGVPGITAEAFVLHDATKASAPVVGYAYQTSLRVDNAVVSELVVSTDSSLSTGAARSDAKAEFALLQRVLPGFSLSETSYPWLATLVVALIAVAVVALALVAPEWAVAAVRRRREKHAIREEQRRRAEYRARGRRVAKRQRQPAWLSTPRARPRRRLGRRLS